MSKIISINRNLTLPRSGHSNESGFALIVAISVMTLLLTLALAILTLVNTETRKALPQDAIAEARANARLGLMLALNDLQEHVGPDQRATATGGITGENAVQQHITGVWDSWRPDPFSPAGDYDSEKRSRFRKWLMSDSDPNVLIDPNFALSGTPTDPVNLIAEGTLGPGATPENFLAAGKVRIQDDELTGSYAYAVIDESVKARIDMPLNLLEDSLAEQSSNLGAPSRAAFEKIFTDFDPLTANAERFISLNSVSIEAMQNLGQFTHDMTIWSQGPLTDVVNGGLREDLNLITDGRQLPNEFAGTRVYSGTNNPVGVGDPFWETIFDYSSLYKRINENGGLPEIQAQAPGNYSAFTGDPTVGNPTVNPVPPEGSVLVPTVAKVQLVFSLVSRDLHTPWSNIIPREFPNRTVLAHLVYSPIVTLHNPYNVALRFNSLRLDFRNVPVGFRFFHNGQLQNTSLASLNNMNFADRDNPNAQKQFGMTLTGVDSSGAPDPSEGLIMQPGEVRVFSSYLPPNYTFSSDENSGWSQYFDFLNNLTDNIQGVPGWRGPGIGFNVDTLTNPGTRTAAGDRFGVLSMNRADTIQIEYGPLAPQAAGGRLSVASTLSVGGNDIEAGVIEFDYGSNNNLQSILPPPSGRSYLFPQPGEPPLTANDIYEGSDTPISDYSNIRPFAVFSAYAMTPNGGESQGSIDGRFATKSAIFNNSASNINSINLIDGHGSHYSHQLNFEPLPGLISDWIQIDGNDRGNFITGHTALNGIKFGTQFEIPIIPLQSIANLQNANLASAGHLPKLTYPVSNSWASPLLNPSSVLQTGRDGQVIMDHSFLANDALFDRFYCSTVADYTGAMFGENRETQEVLQDFLSGQRPLLDQRFIPYLFGNNDPAQAAQDILGGGQNPDYQRIAAFQLFRGQWNVNSVSVNAWKAVLAGLHQTNLQVYDTLQQNLVNRQGAQNPMSRLRLPNAFDSQSSNNNTPQQGTWSGYRELTEQELDTLAESIVQQVRARGPFLSLSEFVNRRLTGTEEETLAGALEAAIAQANINQNMEQDGREITSGEVSGYGYANPNAAIGLSTVGAPGSVTQGHILNTLGNSISVRSDTFKIRAYGESTDSEGNIIARAWCEAVVQRFPDYIDPLDEPEVKFDDLMSLINQRFGREFRVVSFRWLKEDEV